MTAERTQNKLAIVDKAANRVEPSTKIGIPIAKVAEPVKPAIQAPLNKLDVTKQVSNTPAKSDAGRPGQVAPLVAQGGNKNQGTSGMAKPATPVKPTISPASVQPGAAIQLASTTPSAKPAQQPKVATQVAPAKLGPTHALSTVTAPASVVGDLATTKSAIAPAKKAADLAKAPEPFKMLASKTTETVHAQTQTVATPADADLNRMAASTPMYRTSADDEHSHYQKLQKSLSRGTFIGVLPGLTQTQNLSYRNNVNFFPLTNYLSEKSGFLLTPVYEPSIKDFRRQILEGRYPLIYVSAMMTDAAVKGGYEPLAMNEAVHATVFVVPVSSGLKTLGDLKSARVAMSANGADMTAGLDALVRAGVQETVTLSDSASQSRAFDEMMKGRFEAAMLSSDFIDAVNEKVKGQFRIIATAQAHYSYAYWARKGAYDATTKQKLVSLLAGMNADRSLDMAREGLKRAANLDTKYTVLTEAEVKSQLEMNARVAAKWPAFAPIDKPASEESIARNRALPVFFPLAHPASRGPVAQGRSLQAKVDHAPARAGRSDAHIVSHRHTGNDVAQLALRSMHVTRTMHFNSLTGTNDYPIVSARVRLTDTWARISNGQIFPSVAQEEESIQQEVTEGSMTDDFCKTRTGFALSTLNVAPVERVYGQGDVEDAARTADSATTTMPGKTATATAVVDARAVDADLIQTKWAALEPQGQPISIDAVEKNAKSSGFFRIDG